MAAQKTMGNGSMDMLSDNAFINCGNKCILEWTQSWLISYIV